MFAFRGRVNSPYNSPNLSTATRSPVGFANEYHKYGRNGHFESILRVRLVVQRRNSDRSWLLQQVGPFYATSRIDCYVTDHNYSNEIDIPK